MAAERACTLPQRAPIREVARRNVAGGTGHQAVTAQARVKKELLSKRRCTGIVGHGVGGIGGERLRAVSESDCRSNSSWGSSAGKRCFAR